MLEASVLEPEMLINLTVLPPSVRVVYQVLRENKPLNVHDIAEKSSYSRRTVQEALKRLNGRNLIINFPDMKDLRRNFYTVNEN
jgi:DNA-binding MarR family transcriptional regulator